MKFFTLEAFNVSTHSRPKAAGTLSIKRLYYTHRFNTQPPEGGWDGIAGMQPARVSFNTQPPEGGWEYYPSINLASTQVSTHSRPKAAGVL